jgi:hypothetical protein
MKRTLINRPGSIYITAFLLGLVIQPIQAQTLVGGYLAVQLDTEEDYLALGGDALLRMGASPITLNPGLTFFLQDAVTEIQINGNGVYPLDLEGDSQWEPFVAGGLAINYFSFDAGPGFEGISETKIGLNVAAGTQLKRGSALVPFAQAQYTMINDWPNRFLVSVGARYTLGQ